MLKVIDHFNTTLQNYLAPNDTELCIPFAEAKKLNKLNEGDHVYLTLMSRDRAEIVKYTHTKELTNGETTVSRDEGMTGAFNFPSGSCVRIDMNSVQVNELVANAVADALAKAGVGVADAPASNPKQSNKSRTAAAATVAATAAQTEEQASE